MTKEKLQKMSAAKIADTLTTHQLAVIGRHSVIKHIKYLRDDAQATAAHNDWVWSMSAHGILKEFER
jgi:hypothetical protein